MDERLVKYAYATAVKKWKDFKADLKKAKFHETLTCEELLTRRDKRVDPTHWEWLVKHWLSQKAKDRSTTGKLNHSKVVTPHTTGSKSFAYVGHDLNALRDAATRHPELLEKAIEKGDLFSHVFGREPRGYVRGVGLGPTPSSLGMDGFRKCTSTKVQMADRGRRKAEEEVQLIKGTMQQLIEEVGDLREAINVGQGPQRRGDETLERVSNPTAEHGSNPTPNGSIPTLDTMRGVGTKHSDHEFNKELTNSPDVEVRMPWRGRTLFQPRTHQGARKEVILLSIERPRDQPVANGTIQTTNPEARVGGSLLGSECYEVVVNTVMRSDHLLPQQYGKFMTLADSLGQSIAWPHLNILTEERAAKQSEIERLQRGPFC